MIPAVDIVQMGFQPRQQFRQLLDLELWQAITYGNLITSDSELATMLQLVGRTVGSQTRRAAVHLPRSLERKRLWTGKIAKILISDTKSGARNLRPGYRCASTFRVRWNSSFTPNSLNFSSCEVYDPVWKMSDEVSRHSSKQ